MYQSWEQQIQPLNEHRLLTPTSAPSGILHQADIFSQTSQHPGSIISNHLCQRFEPSLLLPSSPFRFMVHFFPDLILAAFTIALSIQFAKTFRSMDHLQEDTYGVPTLQVHYMCESDPKVPYPWLLSQIAACKATRIQGRRASYPCNRTSFNMNSSGSNGPLQPQNGTHQ